MASWEEIRFTIVDEIRSVLADVSQKEIMELSAAIRDAHSVFVAGAGRSGLAMRAFAMRLMHLALNAHVVGDATTPSFREGDLLIVGSASGNTGSLVSAADRAAKRGGTIALVTTSQQSPIGKLAKVIVNIPAPTPKLPGSNMTVSRQPMATLFEQCLWVLLDSCVLLIMEQTGASELTMFERHANLE